MPLHVLCPGCRTPLRIADENRAGQVRCPGCNTVMRIPAAPVAGDTRERRAGPGRRLSRRRLLVVTGTAAVIVAGAIVALALG